MKLPVKQREAVYRAIYNHITQLRIDQGERSARFSGSAVDYALADIVTPMFKAVLKALDAEPEGK